jgi:hypothetical protein
LFFNIIRKIKFRHFLNIGIKCHQSRSPATQQAEAG